MTDPTAAVLWDVDRTLLDAGPLTRDVLAATIAAVLPGAPADAGPLIIGGTDTQVLRDLATAAGADPDAVLPALIAEFAARTRASIDDIRAQGRVLPGVVELVNRLRRAEVVQTVVTGNIRTNAELKLTAFGLIDVMDLDLGAYADEHPDRSVLVQRALGRVRERYGDDVSPWVVGDTPRDLYAARVAGLRCLLVATGVYGVHELSTLGPDVLVEDLAGTGAIAAVLTGSAEPAPVRRATEVSGG